MYDRMFWKLFSRYYRHFGSAPTEIVGLPMTRRAVLVPLMQDALRTGVPAPDPYPLGLTITLRSTISKRGARGVTDAMRPHAASAYRGPYDRRGRLAHA